MPTLLYISQIAPVGDGATPAVIHRHLAALEAEGHHIAVAIPEDVASACAARLPSSWLCIPLPQRRAYYPPYRPGAAWTRGVRWLLFDRLLNRALRGRRVAAVLGLLQGEYLVNYAGWTSRRRQAPLFLFYHDRSERLYFNADAAGAARVRAQNLRLLRLPRLIRVWTVCPELAYSEIPAERFRVVYPVAEPILAALPSWQPHYARPSLAYAGSIYAEVMAPMRAIVRQLAARGGRLQLFSHMREQAEQLVAESPQTVSYHGNVMAADLHRLLRTDCSGFVVAYPDDWRQMAWCLDCFPSKLTQLAQTGLPGLVFAPPETSTAHWCGRADWSLHRPDTSEASVHALLEAVASPEGWTRGAEDSRRAAAGDFNPAQTIRLVNRDVETAAAGSLD